MICELHERMVTNRRRLAEARAITDGDAQGRVINSGAASPEAPCAGNR